MNICELIHPYQEVTIKTEELQLLDAMEERYWRKGESPRDQLHCFRDRHPRGGRCRNGHRGRPLDVVCGGGGGPCRCGSAARPPRTGGPGNAAPAAFYVATSASVFQLRPLSKTALGFVRFTLFSMLAASSYHQQQSASQQNAQQTVAPASTVNPSDTNNLSQPPQPPPQQGQPFQSVLRLHDDPANSNQPTTKSSRKRKSPPTAQEQQHPPPPPPVLHQPPPGVMPPPPPHSLMHPPHMGPPLPYQYIPQDYTPGGLTHPPPPPPGAPSPDQSQQGGRTLSQSKRAEQNRKAQRAFRERRDQ